MDHLEHPLDWWAHGGYAEVMHRMNCTKPVARRTVNRKIAEFYQRTGDPIWKPIGNHGYATLRRAIMAHQILDHDLQ